MDSPSITGARRYLSMEPLAFILMFAYSISDNVKTDMIEYQECKYLKEANASVCDILHNSSLSNANETKELKDLVQKHIGPVLTLTSCIETIFPTILVLFLGPWSDKNGRKPLLIFPFIGLVLYDAGWTILSALNISNPYWFLLPSLAASLLGGFPPILLAFFSYVTDITDKDNRSWHLACLETSISAGLLVGLFAGPAIFTNCGYTTVFALSTVVRTFALLHVFFYVKETIVTDRKRTLASVFDFPLVKELFCAVTKKRDGFDRGLLWSCIFYIALHVVIWEGNGSFSFLFCNLKLRWDVSQYSIFSGTHLLISISGMLLLIKFSGSVLKLPNIVILVIACLSLSGGNLMRAFVTEPWQMYLSASISMFGVASVPVMRSIISKSVPPKDVAKAFSVTTIMEMVVPFATTPLYIYIYTHTLSVYPYPFYCLSAALPLIMLVLAIIAEKRWRRFRETLYTPFVPVDN